MSCKGAKYIIKEIIISSDTGLQGPQGIPGIQGPPGTIPTTYPADQVTVTNLGYSFAQEIFDFLLYVNPVISGFSGGPTQYELGLLLTSLSFTWSLNKNVVSQTLVGPAEMTPVVLTAGQRSVTVILANLSSNSTFTLTVDDGQNQVQSNFNISFVNRNYFGDAIIPGTIDDTFVKSLQSILKANRSHNYIIDAVGAQYNWYCHPSRYGTPTFYANGFEGGWSLITTLVGFTNDFGYSEDYSIWRSDNPDIGPGVNAQVS